MLVFRRPGHREWREAGPNRGLYHSWRRDGRSFCYLRGSAVECDSLDGRSVTRHPLEGTPLRWVNDLPWMGLDLDDSPFVTLLIGRPDIYALDWEAP
jgi:hypothetical protein